MHLQSPNNIYLQSLDWYSACAVLCTSCGWTCLTVWWLWSILLLGRVACTQCIRCSLLLRMSHVAWSMCLSVCCAMQKRMNRSRWRLGLILVTPRNHVINGVEISIAKGQFLGNSFLVAFASERQFKLFGYRWIN